MNKAVLILPDFENNCIGYFFERMKEMAGVPMIRTIYLSKKVLERMLRDEFIHEKDNVWLGDEVTINGKYYPKLLYKGHCIESFSLYMIDYIKYDGIKFNFDSNGKTIFFITNEEAKECKLI